MSEEARRSIGGCVRRPRHRQRVRSSHLHRRKLAMAHVTNTSEKALRGLVLVTALAVLLFPVAAWADLVELTSGGATQGPVGNSFFLAAFGDQFALTANLIQQSNPGTFPPSDFFVGRTILVHVGF